MPRRCGRCRECLRRKYDGVDTECRLYEECCDNGLITSLCEYCKRIICPCCAWTSDRQEGVCWRCMDNDRFRLVWFALVHGGSTSVLKGVLGLSNTGANRLKGLQKLLAQRLSTVPTIVKLWTMEGYAKYLTPLLLSVLAGVTLHKANKILAFMHEHNPSEWTPISRRRLPNIK